MKNLPKFLLLIDPDRVSCARLKNLSGGHPIVAIFVCTQNINLAMESVTRKGRALLKSVDNSMAFFC